MAEPDVHIRRCDVRLVRSAADGAALMERADHLALARRMRPLVLGMIEQFVAERLSREGDDLAIARLDIELVLPADVQQGALPLARAAIRQRIDAAVSLALARARVVRLVAPRPAEAVPVVPVVVAAPAVAAVLSDGILQALADWLEQRQLTLRLSLLGPVALVRLFERVRDALRDLAPEPAPGRSAALTEVRRIAEPDRAGGIELQLREWIGRVALWALGSRSDADPNPALERRGRLLEQAEELTRLAGNLHSAATQDPSPEPRFGQQGDDPGSRPDDAPASLDPMPRIDDTARLPPGTSQPPSALPNGRYEIACALPYLAMLRLAEHGVLSGLPVDDPALGALAYATALKQMSPPPEPRRPWREDLTKAAGIFAGFVEAPDGAALVQAAGGAEALLELASGGVNAAMRPALIELAALPAVQAAGHVVAFDPVGFYPAGAVPAAALTEVLGGTHALLVMPAGDAAGLRLAADAGHKAACAGTPATREGFARVNGPRGWRGMANVPAPTLAGHHHLLRALSERVERGQAVWSTLTERRPLAAPAAQAQIAPLDRCASLMAGFALADIAYRLSQHDPSGWRDPDPLLALDRFGDLSARVDVSDDEVAVTVPLGARFADLFAARLLDVTPRLPWLNGRVLRVGGG